MRFWSRPTKVADVVAAVNEFGERRTELLAELAAELLRLEARLAEVTLAQVALLSRQGLVPTQPEQQGAGDAPWFNAEQEFEPESQASEVETSVERPEPQPASLFAPKAEVRGVPRSAAPAAPGTVPTFAQVFPQQPQQNGEEMSPSRRAELIKSFLGQPQQVPVS